ncbi:MAG: hypothetical protein RIR12_1733 [Bacteroidota bacterium]|jgi:hypothetical protein
MGKIITINAFKIRKGIKEAGLETSWDNMEARTRFRNILVQELQIVDTRAGRKIRNNRQKLNHGSYYASEGKHYINISTNRESDDALLEILHEVQHAIQSESGTAMGADNGAIFDRKLEEFSKEQGRSASANEQRTLADEANREYISTYGEIEAKATQRNSFMSENERIFNSTIEKTIKERGIDKNDITYPIMSDIDFMKTPNGVVYGFQYTDENGKPQIVIDESLLNPNTPIHEMAHVWVNAIQEVAGVQSGGVNEQIIGEVGAENLPIVRGNLQVARDMEAAGETPKEIYVATGWERTKDNGKWKYDLPDIEFENYTSIAKQIIDLQSKNDKNEYFTIPITEITGAVWSAFPDGRDVTIQVINNPDFEYQGEYDGRVQTVDGGVGKFITINAYKIRERLKKAGLDTDWNNMEARNRFRSVLIHELQHFVQDKEGFARGSNFDETNLLNKGFANKADFNAAVKNLEYQVDLLNKQADYIRDKDRIAYEEISGDIRKLLSDLSKLKTFDYRSAEKTYLKIAGEVEARNAQIRAKMTPEQRKEKMLSETEDVAEDSKIYIYYSNGQQNSVTNEQVQQVLEKFPELQQEAKNTWEAIRQVVMNDFKENGANSYLGRVMANSAYNENSDKPTEKQIGEAIVTAVGDAGEKLVNAAEKSKFKNAWDKFFELLGKLFGLEGKTPQQIAKMKIGELAKNMAVDVLRGKTDVTQTQQAETQATSTIEEASNQALQSVESTAKDKEWSDFIDYKRNNEISDNLKGKSLKQLNELLNDQQQKFDRKVRMGQRDTQLRQLIWDIKDLINAHEKANEHNKNLSQIVAKNATGQSIKQNDFQYIIDKIDNIGGGVKGSETKRVNLSEREALILNKTIEKLEAKAVKEGVVSFDESHPINVNYETINGKEQKINTYNVDGYEIKYVDYGRGETGIEIKTPQGEYLIVTRKYGKTEIAKFPRLCVVCSLQSLRKIKI